MAADSISGGKLIAGGLVLLAIPSVVERMKLSDMATAMLLLVPTVAGLSCLVIGIYRLVKPLKEKTANNQ